MKRSPVLLVAHPGHELRLHRWLELAHPVVFVLTDGSGSAGHSRVPSTHDVLAKTGAGAGSILAPFTDHEIYDAIMRGDAAPLAEVTLRLAEAFVDAAFVVADSWEAYNPTHDLCHIVADLATERASRLADRAIPLYEYAVVGHFEPQNTAGEIIVQLDEHDAERKIAAAYEYAELRSDVDEMLRSVGPDRLRLELLRPAMPPVTEEKPFYEQRGEQQVATGRYDRVLRYREHVAPFVEALQDAVRRAPLPAHAQTAAHA